MRKTLVLILFALLSIGAVWGQGFESFANFPATGTSYSDGTFLGQDGSTWSYVQARGDVEITEKAMMIGRNRTPQSETYSGTISGGIGTITFDYKQAYSTAVNLNVYVNDVLVGNVSSNQQDDVLPSGDIVVNVPGDFTLKFRNANNSDGQVVIDNISWTGYTGAPTPTINLSGTLSAFSAWTGSPSDAQSYTLSGSNLTGNINVVAPDGYVLSTDQTTWTGSLSLASSFNGLVYVRLTGATAGSFSGNITHNSTGAAEVTLAASGTVTDPTPAIVLTGNLNAFSAVTGSPSASQSYTVEGQFLVDPIVVTPPAGYELSTNNSTWSSTLELANNYNGLVYIRLIGTTAGTYDGNIIHSSLLVLQEKAVTGTVTDPLPATSFLEENFLYTVGTLLTDNGWIRHSGTANNGPVVASEGLAYASYPPSSGLAGRIQGNGDDVHKNLLEAQTSGTVYNSFLINVTSATEAGDYVYHYATNVDGTSDFKGKFFVGRDASNNVRFGLTKSANVGTSVAWSGYDYALNTTYLVVLKYEIVPGSANDIVTAWINPTIGDTESTPLLSAIVSETDIGILGVGSVGIRQSSASLTAIFDGIRVTNDWALLWDGTPPPTPVIIANPTDLEPLAAIVNSPSDEIRSYTLYGTDLQGPITIVAPTGFQVSTSETEGWDSEIAVPSSFNSTIYVRMFPEVSGEFSGIITHNSPNATQVDIAVSGEGIEPPTTWNITANLTAFSSEAGTPSAAQSYTLSATNATENLALTVDAPFEISTSETEGYSSSLSLAPTFNGTIWVRMNPVTAGEFSGNITHTTTNASPYELAVSGTATLAPGNYATDLFFSEYTEAASGSNKLLEIFNGTGLPVDLSAYSVKLASNGGAWDNTLAMAGSLANNDLYIIANASSTAELLAIADVTSNVTFYNGDDAVGLFKNDVLIDIIGVQGVDPGSAWPVAGVSNGTVDHTLIRKPTVIVGNTDFVIGAGTSADNSEWIVMPWNDYTNLGSHLFTPGMEMADTPEITPAGGLYYSAVDVSITAATPGSVIRYTTDGSDPVETSTQYTAPFQVTANATVKARAYAAGFAPSAVAMNTYNFPVTVTNIAALRAMPTGSTIYQLTGEAILTFQQSSRYQKYIQDATAAIVIDDPSHFITTSYNLYDGITGIAGTLGLFNNLLQFTPVADPGAATSTGNVVVPELRTLASLTTADQGKLVKIENVMLDATLVNFPSAASNINGTDPTATLVMRTFLNADYSGTPIPTVAQDIICLVGQSGTAMQFSPRFLADFSNHPAGQLETPVVTISVDGNTISLNWPLVDGASTYLVEGATDPYGTYTTIETVNTNTWSGAAEGMKFFKVTAQP